MRLIQQLPDRVMKPGVGRYRVTAGDKIWSS